MTMHLPGAILCSIYFYHSAMRKVHLVNGHVVYVNWIDTVYVQNNLSTEFNKMTIMKRKLTCTNYFIILEKNILREHTKIQMLPFGLAQASHFGLWDIIPPQFQLAFQIYCVKYENTLTCKRIS